MCKNEHHLFPAASAAFTLIEVIVVLLVLGLAASLVAPAFLLLGGEDQSELETVVRGARELAERRGENLYLDVSESGDWSIGGTASVAEEPIAVGRLDGWQGIAFRMVLSPIGTCAFDARSALVAPAIPVDPLTCQVGS